MASDEALLESLERTFAEAVRLAGEQLVCGPGCSQCCHGPFPVTRLDVERLRVGLDRLDRDDPAQARDLRARAHEARARLADGFPGDAGAGRLEAGIDEQRLDAFFARHEGLACPVLDPDSGRCDLYAHRPVACRTYGPPLRHGNRRAPHCPLCFVGADEEEIERCRVEPDPEGLEQALLARRGVAADDEWETLVAFAVAP